ncbi:FtsX-like permease family protein [Haloimpatiens massiliensis]|uniref:FtsX-like permease family protein n=1 Tax=Haloimpatiens massiliensis TaxID=1658110 RepID=UPI000C8486D3|nr:FtsX-like permease family protein [Haloimpatiens massiliensis]
MFRKLLTNVFFEKKRILFAIIIITTILLTYVGIQVAYYSNRGSTLATPDFEVYGKGDIYGSRGYELFGDVSTLSEETKKVLGDDIKVYGMVVRNIETKSKNGFFERINYWVYGVEDSFLEDVIKKQLKEGKMLSSGKDEVVIGAYAANYFKLKVGNKINIPITLGKDMDMKDKGKYIVTGIINENADFFKSGIFMSKNTFDTDKGKTNENAIVGYFKGYKAVEKYKNNYNGLSKLFSKHNIGSINENFRNKLDVKRNIVINISFVCLISIVILFLLVSYFMKGIKKKIGLLKALGISDRYILKVIVGGLGIILLLSLILSNIITFLVSLYMNKSISDFLGFSVEVISINWLVILVETTITLVQVITISIAIKLISAKISPRDSMIKS